MRFRDGDIPLVERDEFARAKRHGYASWHDGRPQLLYLCPVTGATVLGEVEIAKGPLIERKRRYEQS